MSKSIEPLQYSDLLQKNQKARQDAPETIERGGYFDAGDKKVYIDHTDMRLVYQLRELPARTRIAILAISGKDMEDFIHANKRELADRLRVLMRQRWHWRDTGDAVEWNDIDICAFTKLQLMRRLKAPDQFTIEQLFLFLDFFEGDNAEIYTP